MAVAQRSINSSTVILCNSSYEASWAFAGTDAALGQRLCRVRQFMSFCLNGSTGWALCSGCFGWDFTVRHTTHCILSSLPSFVQVKPKQDVHRQMLLSLLWKQIALETKSLVTIHLLFGAQAGVQSKMCSCFVSKCYFSGLQRYGYG